MDYEWIVEERRDDGEWSVTARCNCDWLAKKTAREDFSVWGRENRVRNERTGAVLVRKSTP